MTNDKKPDSPFAKLASMRDALPEGPAPAAATTVAVKKEKPIFGEKVVVRHERKGHGGKTVTVVAGVLPRVVEDFAGEMKKALGCGARVEAGEILLQGDLVERAALFLEKKGAKRVVRGSK